MFGRATNAWRCVLCPLIRKSGALSLLTRWEQLEHCEDWCVVNPPDESPFLIFYHLSASHEPISEAHALVRPVPWHVDAFYDYRRIYLISESEAVEFQQHLEKGTALVVASVDGEIQGAL